MKVHLSIGHARSLCGMSPQHGSYDIRSIATFFHSPEADQCSRCLYHFTKRGYSVTSARAAAKFGPIQRAEILADRVGA